MYRPTAASSSRQGQGRCGDRPAVVAGRDVPGQGGQQLGGDRAEQPFDLPSAAGSSRGAVDQLHLQVGAHLGDVGAGEVGAVVAVQDRGHPAHRPAGVGLAPDRLPQRQRGLRGGRITEEHGVPGDRPGVVVQDHRQPRPGRPAGLVEHHHVQLGVIGLPDVVGVRRFPPQDQFEIVPVHVRVVMRHREQTTVQALDDPTHRLVGRRRPALLGSDDVHRPVDLGDPRRRPPQRQALDQLDDLRRHPPRAPVGPSRPGQSVGTVRPVGRQPPPRRPQRHTGLLRDRRQRNALEQMRLQHRQPLLHVEAHQHHPRRSAIDPSVTPQVDGRALTRRE